MKKKLVSVVLAVAVVASLVGCGAGKDTAEKKETAKTEGEKVTIQFMHQQVEQERQDVVKSIIEKFEEKNPNIKVEQIPVNEDDYDSKIVALGGSGELPAIVEYSQDQAKTSVTNQFTNVQAVGDVIKEKGEDSFLKGALSVVKTEDGKDFVGVPLCGWVQGIWVNEAMLKEKGFTTPKNWDEVLKIAEAFNDPGNKKYGIAIPTSDTVFTEQVFSQFALSNGANVFDADGKVKVDTPEMKEALDFYAKLASTSMPGSTEVADVKDAFVGKNTPMAMYSTYILNSVVEAGFINDLSLVLPNKTTEAAYGCVTVLGIAADMDDAKTEAAKKFVSFLLEDENNISWLQMAPGGVQPVLGEVSKSEELQSNEKMKQFAHLSDDTATAFENLKLFGTVGDKNFMIMGDITNTGILSKMVNNVVVQGAGAETEIKTAQAAIEKLVK